MQPTQDTVEDPGHLKFRNLQIKDLILVSILVSVFVAFYRQTTIELFGGESTDNPPVSSLPFLLNQALTSGIFVAFLFWIRESKRRIGKYLLHPGYWLLVALGMNSIGTTLQMATFIPLGNSNTALGIAGTIISSIFRIFSWCTCLVAVFRLYGAWKIPFLILVLNTPTIIVATFILGFRQLQFVIPLISCVGGIAVAAAILADWYNQEKRDWIHWLGVALFLVSALVFPLAGIIAQQFS